MDSIKNQINSKCWTDAIFNKIEMDYDDISIDISINDNKSVKIYCNNYIGIHCSGHWDENVIKDIIIVNDSMLIDECIQNIQKNYGANPCKGGGMKNINDQWYQMKVVFIDGNIIEIVCNGFKVLPND